MNDITVFLEALRLAWERTGRLELEKEKLDAEAEALDVKVEKLERKVLDLEAEVRQRTQDLKGYEDLKAWARNVKLGKITVEPLQPTAEEKDFIRQGMKIDALKSLRARTGFGLKDAKDVLEAWCDPGLVEPADEFPF